MTKYVLINRELDSDDLSRIQKAFPNHTIIDEVDEQIEFTEIEIVLGWEEEIIDWLKGEHQVKWIQVTSAGVDHLPLDLLAEQKVLLTAAKGVSSGPITESVFAVLLSHLRGTVKAYDDQATATWDRPASLPELHGKTMMIVGVGNIGRQIATIARAFGVRTIGINRSGRDIPEVDEQYVQADLEKVIHHADIVVNVLPATPETEGLYNEAIFQAMKDQTIFINVGRGEAVVDADLIRALEEGKVAFAALDVFREEPLPEDHPYWKRKDVFVMPHMTSAQENYYGKVVDVFEENAKSYLETGEVTTNVIDLSKGY